MSEYTKSSDVPDYEHKEDFDNDKTAFSRMMSMYRDAAINGNPDEILEADYGKHWATVRFNNGSETTWEILEEV